MTNRFSTDQIIDIVQNTDLGLASDGSNHINGMLVSYMNGAAQALYNIAKDPNALNYSLEHVNDVPDDVWEKGYYAVISLYFQEKKSY
jgi:hypothetical protein